MAFKGIGEYGIIGNMHTAALVGTDGSIDWCCLPRFDSPSIFAAILDDEKGGRFHIKPQIPFESRQDYLPNTNVLQTSLQAATGEVEVIDFMPCYSISRRRLTHSPEIHRLVDCTEGEVTLEAVFEPRMNYARDSTVMNTSKYGVAVNGKAETLALSSTIPFAIDAGRAITSFTLQQGERAHFILRYGVDKPRPPGMYNAPAKLEQTMAYWQQKAEGCLVSGPWRQEIVRSYLALHLLLYSPTGAIIAAHPVH